MKVGREGGEKKEREGRKKKGRRKEGGYKRKTLLGEGKNENGTKEEVWS